MNSPELTIGLCNHPATH